MSFEPKELPVIKALPTLSKNLSVSTPVNKKRDRYSDEFRREKLLSTIEQHLGPSSNTVHRFDVARLEKQALQFLKLEDDESRASGKNPDSKPNFMTSIIAACCYI